MHHIRSRDGRLGITGLAVEKSKDLEVTRASYSHYEAGALLCKKKCVAAISI